MNGYLGPSIESYSDVSTLAKYIFDKYDRDRGGNLGHTEIASIMSDMYKSVNKGFNPSKSDTDGYLRLLDSNKDGKVDIKDIEAMITKYLKINVEVTRSTTGSRSSILMPRRSIAPGPFS